MTAYKQERGGRWMYGVAGALMALLIFSCSIKAVAVRSLSSWEVGRAFALRMNEVIDKAYPDADTRLKADLQMKVGQEKSLQRAVGDYLDAAVEAAVKKEAMPYMNPDQYASDIAEETAQMAQKMLGDRGTERPDRLDMQKDLTEEAREALKALGYYAAGLSDYGSYGQWMILTYDFLTSRWLRLFAGGGIAALWALGFWKNKLRGGIAGIGLSLATAGAMAALISLMMDYAGMDIANRLVGRSVDIAQAPILQPAAGCLIAGILTGMIMRKTDSGREGHEDTDQAWH